MVRAIIAFCSSYIVLIVILLVIVVVTKCHGSESPQRDLQKRDYRDWYFNHKDDYALNQPEYRERAKGSDGDRLMRELEDQTKKHFKGER